MNKEENDKLKAIFIAIKQEAPSMSFENNLMQRVRRAQHMKERRSNRLALFAISGGIASMILVPIVVLQLLGIPLSQFFFNPQYKVLDAFRSMEINPTVISISLVCFLLLMIDMFVRKHLREKKHKD